MKKIRFILIPTLLLLIGTALFGQTSNESRTPIVTSRDGLFCLAQKAKHSSDIRIAFYGSGILTQYNIQSELTKLFAKNFPKSRVENFAERAETGEMAAYRFEFDILSNEPDLVVLDLALPEWNRPKEEILKIADSLVRKAWRQDASTEFLFVYPYRTYSKSKSGQRPESIDALETIAEKYGIPSIDLYSATIHSKDTVVKSFKSDGNFAAESGRSFYCRLLAEGLTSLLISPSSVNADHYNRLTVPAVPNNFERFGMSAILPNMKTGTWIDEMRIESSSRSSYSRTGVPVWASSTAGDKIVFRFRGKSAKIYDIVGFDSAAVRVTVDGTVSPKPIVRRNIKASAHYPSILPVADGLDPKSVHTVTLEVVGPGTFRIAKLLLDGEVVVSDER